jgi:hypothetical protein
MTGFSKGRLKRRLEAGATGAAIRGIVAMMMSEILRFAQDDNALA